MDPLTIATAVAKSAATAWDVGALLYKLIQNTRVVDDSVKNLASEVDQLVYVCDAVKRQLEALAKQQNSQSALVSELHDRETARIGAGIKSQLAECDRAVKKLKNAISGVRRKRSNAVTQTWRQISLNMSRDDIEESRTQIRVHTTNLQISLQLVTLKAVYLAPKFANQELITIMDEIKTMVTEHGQKIDVNIVQSARDLISSGTTLYEESVVGGSVIPDADEVKKNTRTIEWLERFSSLQLDASASANPAVESGPASISSVADDAQKIFTTVTTTDRGVHLDYEDNCDDTVEELGEDFALEAAQTAITSGLEAFSTANYQLADSDLQEALILVHELPMDLRRDCDISELQFKLAVCAFYIHGIDDAETALVSVIEAQSHSNREALNLCHAGHLLAQVYTKQGKLDLARASCENALRGRRKLLGKEDTICYESLALLSKIYELQKQEARARIFLRMIPKDVQESVCLPLCDLAVSENSTQVNMPQVFSTKRKDETSALKNSSVSESAPASSSMPTSIHIQWSKSKKLGRFPTCVYRVTFSPDGKYIATTKDGAIVLWDPATGLELKRLDTTSRVIVFSSNSKLIASTEDREITLWDPSTGVRVRSIGAEDPRCASIVAFSPDNRLIVSAHQKFSSPRWYSSLRVSDASTGVELKRLTGQQSRILGVAFSPNGTVVTSVSDDNVLLWDLSGEHKFEKLDVKGQAAAFSAEAAAISPDGTLIAMGMSEIVLWDVKKKTEVKRLRGHGDLAISLAFSPDGRVLASGGFDYTVRLWDLSTGTELKRFDEHQDIVWSVAFSPDGKLVASCSHDKTARLWDVSSFLPEAS